MNAKSCMLCGRPLGRIRVGAGGDFCSREHRNQYRLRRSMDCLTEANKVSTLARRRENPKPLFADAAPGTAKLAARGFLEAPSMMLSATRRPAAPERQARRDIGGHLPEASLAQLTRAAAGAMGGPRAFGMSIPGAGRRAVAGRSGKLAAGRLTMLSERYRNPGKVAPAANKGNAFHVAAKVGFHAPPVGPRAVAARSGPPAPRGLQAAPHPVPLFAPGRVAAAGRAGSRLMYGEMGFTGSPDAPAPAGWVGLVSRKGLAREYRVS